MEKITVIGSKYNRENEIVDTVIDVHGFSLNGDDGFMHIYEVGDKYRDGIIVDCFYHPESDCIWFIVNSNDVYFNVEITGFDRLNILWEELPFK